VEALKKDRSYMIMLVLFFAWVIGFCDKIAISVAAIPIGEEFGFNKMQIGLIMSSFFSSYAVMTLFGGVLADKYGSRKVLTAIIFCWSLFTAMTGFAWSLASFMVIRFLFGAAEGGFPSASSVTIAELFPKEKRGRAKSFIISAAQVGVAIGTLAVTAFTATVGWRWAFWTYGLIGIIIALAFWTIFRLDKQDGNSVEQIKSKLPLMNILRIPLVWKLLVMQFAIGTFNYGLTFWLPSYWVQVKGLNIVTMGALTAMVAVISFVCVNFGGWILDKHMVGRERIMICITLSIAGVCTFLMYNADSVQMAFIYLTVANTAIAVTSPVIFTLALKYLPEEFIGTGTGMCNFGQQIGGMISPAIFGYFIHIFLGSYFEVFTFVIITVIISLITAFTINTRELS